MSGRTDRKVRPYTRRDLSRAANLSALLGWLAVSTLLVWLFGPLALFFAMLLGLPIAFAACWLLGAPLLWRLMRRRITWLGAAGWGAIIAGLIAALGMGFRSYVRWQQHQTASSQDRVSGGDSLRSVEGVLTAYGWWGLAQVAVLFILAGVVIALILRAIIGPGWRP